MLNKDNSYPLIRSMEKEDLPAILKIEHASYSHPWAESLFLGCFRENYSCLVITVDEEMAGYVLLMTGAEEGHILNICIAQSFRRKGFAVLLLEAIRDESLRLGVKTIFLEVRESNHGAQRLYEDFGFNEIGLRSNYYPVSNNRREDARVMALMLTF